MIEPLLYLVAITVLAILVHRQAKSSARRASYWRKVLHIFSISICAVAAIRIPEIWLLQLIVGLSLPAVVFLVWKGYLADTRAGRKSWGIVYFVLIYFILLLAFAKRPEIIFHAMLVLALADGFATVVGENLGASRRVGGDVGKSIPGSLTFFAFSVFSLHLIPLALLPRNFMIFDLAEACMIGGILTLVEAISEKSSDNLWIPVLTVYFAFFVERYTLTNFAWYWLAILPLMAIVYRMRWLTLSGLVAAVVMACLLLASPDSPLWIWPPVLFLTIGSLVSKLPEISGSKNHESRNAVQVAANGSIGLACFMLFFLTDSALWILAGYSAFAAALSDTVSSEIGRRFGRPTFYILGFRRVAQGRDGGISAIGSTAGVLGAALMAALAFAIVPNLNLKMVALILFCGFLGNLSDSIYGQLFQAKQRPAEPSWHPNPTPLSRKGLISGWQWMSNSAVNWFATLTAALLSIAFFLGSEAFNF